MAMRIMSGIWGRLRWSNSQCTKTPRAGTRGAVRNSGASEGRDTKGRQFELDGRSIVPAATPSRALPARAVAPRVAAGRREGGSADQPLPALRSVSRGSALPPPAPQRSTHLGARTAASSFGRSLALAQSVPSMPA